MGSSCNPSRWDSQKRGIRCKNKIERPSDALQGWLRLSKSLANLNFKHRTLSRLSSW